jgi:hypothetical protein
MTHDPEVQRAIDAAAAELARRIRANPSPADPDAMAAAYLEDLHAAGWRPIPRPQPITGGRKDPAVYARGAEQARQMLAARRAEPQGDTDA